MGVYVFDDGLDQSVFERTAAGVVELLQPLALESGDPPGNRGPYLKTVRQLPVDPVEILKNADHRKLLGEVPAAWVVLGIGNAINTLDPKLIRWEQSVRVYIASGVSGRLVSGRMTDAAEAVGQDPGTYSTLAHVTEYLNHAALPTVDYSGPIKVTEHMPVFSGPDLSVWRLTLSVEIQQCVNPDRDAVLIDAIEANHGVDGKGTIATQILEF